MEYNREEKVKLYEDGEDKNVMEKTKLDKRDQWHKYLYDSYFPCLFSISNGRKWV